MDKRVPTLMILTFILLICAWVCFLVVVLDTLLCVDDVGFVNFGFFALEFASRDGEWDCGICAAGCRFSKMLTRSGWSWFSAHNLITSSADFIWACRNTKQSFKPGRLSFFLNPYQDNNILSWVPELKVSPNNDKTKHNYMKVKWASPPPYNGVWSQFF